MLACKSSYSIHFTYAAIEVNRNNSFGPGSNRRLELFRVHVVIITNIYEDWLRTRVDNGRDGGDKSMTYRNYLVTRPDSCSKQTEMQRVIAAIHSNRILYAHELSQVLLEIA